MSESLVAIGLGGFGREVLDVVDAINNNAPGSIALRGVADDIPSPENLARLAARGVAYLGTTDEVAKAYEPANFVVGIGSPRVRQVIAHKLEGLGWRGLALIHPSATSGFGVTVGAGCVICAGVRITTNVLLGKHVHLNLNTTVGHDAEIEDFVSVNPLAAISGDVRIEHGALIGTAASILEKITVGSGAVVGAGSCVTRNVAVGAIVKGVPAR